MRGPLKYLALLFLVPFLACTDTPAEPDTEETASLKIQPPNDWGDWLVVEIKCGGNFRGYVWAGDEVPLAYDCCQIETYECQTQLPYVPMPDGTFRVAFWVFEQPTILACQQSWLSVTAADLPINYECLRPRGDKRIANIKVSRVNNE